jgi:toxin ParE1/3/4
MTGRIVRRPEARLDVLELGLHIARDSEAAANRFVAAVQSAYEQLARLPGMGTVHRFKNPQFGTLRIWSVPGFRHHLIFYRELPDGIEVIRILHASRDWEAIFEQ